MSKNTENRPESECESTAKTGGYWGWINYSFRNIDNSVRKDYEELEN